MKSDDAEHPGAGGEELMDRVYDELRGLARAYLARERPGHTLEPTALVHEAYLRLAAQSRVDWRGRSHVFAIGAKVMRRLLIDHARRYRRVRHGGDWRRVTFGDHLPAFGEGASPEQLLLLDDALERLAELDGRQAQVVELRCFGGLGIDEIAELLGVSRRSVERDWTHAKAWLGAEVEGL
ncbi:MAG: ECF-type sigma factor [Acidobacteriota bacterium]